MGRILDPLRQLGSKLHAREEGTNELCPIIVDNAGRLRGGIVTSTVSSAQVKSCLVLAGLWADGPVRIIQPEVSRDHTERMLQAMGAHVRTVEGGVEVTPLAKPLTPFVDATIPGDPSSAAFFLVAASLVPGGQFIAHDLSGNQGRLGFVRVLERMGVAISASEKPTSMGEPVADISVVNGGQPLRATNVTRSEVPALIDEIPILAIAASQAHGTTVFSGIEELRVKETDRITAMRLGLAALGVDVEETPDSLVVHGPCKLLGGAIRSFGDHRIAMSFAVAGLVSESSVEVDDAEWVDISFPGFFDVLFRCAPGSVG
jgi:3-phosphoshikimate 1-carboxyvinyltransferase